MREMLPELGAIDQTTFGLERPVTVAVNCCVWPAAKLTLCGLTVTGAVTVSVVVAFTAPDTALIVVGPCPTLVASPAALIVATVSEDELHVAVDVRFAVLASL